MIQDSSAEAEGVTQLRHRYRVSADLTAPLIYLVHGRAGNHRVMWPFTRTIPDAFNIIAPEAPLPDPIGGFSWWDVSDPARIMPQAEKAAVQLEAFFQQAQQFYRLTPRFILAFGFSQGGGLLSLLLQKKPDFAAGVALLASFVLRTETPPPKGAAQARIFIAHGTKDEAVSLAKSEEGVAYLTAHGFEVTTAFDDVGHKVGTAGMRALKSWVATF